MFFIGFIGHRSFTQGIQQSAEDSYPYIGRRRRRISWTEPIMRRDVKTINTGIRRKLEKGEVFLRSVSHQYVGFYQYTEILGYGDGQLPRVCRCLREKKDEKGYFF